MLSGRTGGIFVAPAGTCVLMPFAGDGRTMWYGGTLNILGAPPGSKAQLVDQNNVIIAEAIVGFGGQAQFFRPPKCDFPIGMFPNLRLMLSAAVSISNIVFCSAPTLFSNNNGFPLFINSQNWTPKQYETSQCNNFAFTANGRTMMMQCTKENAKSIRILPPLTHYSYYGLRPRL